MCPPSVHFRFVPIICSPGTEPLNESVLLQISDDFVFICTINHKTLYPSLYCSSISVIYVLYLLIADLFSQISTIFFSLTYLKVQCLNVFLCPHDLLFLRSAAVRVHTHAKTHRHTLLHPHSMLLYIELRRQHITVFVFKQTHLMNDPTFVFLQSLTSFNVNSLTSPHGNVV